MVEGKNETIEEKLYTKEDVLNAYHNCRYCLNVIGSHYHDSREELLIIHKYKEEVEKLLDECVFYFEHHMTTEEYIEQQCKVFEDPEFLKELEEDG